MMLQPMNGRMEVPLEDKNTVIYGGGGALSLAILAASRTDSLLGSDDGPLAALNDGYHAAFLVGALFAVAAAVLGTVLLHATAATAPTDAESAAAPRAVYDPKEAPMQAPD